MSDFDMTSELAAARAYSVPFANSPLMPLLLISLAVQKHSPDTKISFSKEYDYIVVGAGSAGSVVASRLSEMPCVSVLLLEAGKAPPRLTDVPAFEQSFLGSDVDWKYRTVVQKHTARGRIGGTVSIPRAKMLGGSSSHNANEYVRGNRNDYDLWAAGGARGWSFEDVLPYFKKAEDNKNPQFVANGYHGVGGPLTVSNPNYETELKAPLFEAYRNLGLDKIDINGPIQTGAYDVQYTLRNGQRCSTAKAYLVPREKSANLDIVINAHVTKVVIEAKRATGVLFDVQGRSHEVKARREVIVSAGAINTPQVLMLSGVGPADHMRQLGIPCVADLPVGLNLQDHVQLPLYFQQSNEVDNFDVKKNDVKNLKDYIAYRSGPLAASFGVIMHGFLINDGSWNSALVDHPLLQLEFTEETVRGLKLTLTPEVYNQMYAPYENKSMAACMPIVLRPKTLGRVRLQSPDPYDPPIIDYQYFEEPEDLDLMVIGAKLCQRVIESGTMRSAGVRPLATLMPGCEHVAHDEALYFRCVAGMVATTVDHPVGTAKMGDPKDPSTVLDAKLRVKGIAGLRVVDASVMPQIVSGNTNAPTIMIGEKAADIIKETIRCQ